ncbi:MAG: zinc metalloprotease HtpX [Candidatus Roizmanbacteria bacterium]
MNDLKTFLLLALLTALFMLVGSLLGGKNGMWVGLVIAAISNFGAYFFSDRLVLRQFNAKEVSETQQPRLFSVVHRLTSQAGIPMPKVYMIDMPTPNAFATGRDPSHAAIAVSPSIMQMMSEEELTGVLAHEIGHIKNRDILISSLAATMAGALSYIIHFISFTSLRRGSNSNERGNPFSLLLVMIITPIVATLLHMAISRQREYAADEYSAKLTRNPKSLARALSILGGFVQKYPIASSIGQESSAHLFIINPFEASFIRSLFSTHPPLAERIARLNEIKI